jgi:hypothetical protein
MLHKTWVFEGQGDGQQPIILSHEIAPTPALVRAGLDVLPGAILAHGERTARRFIEFLPTILES